MLLGCLLVWCCLGLVFVRCDSCDVYGIVVLFCCVRLVCSVMVGYSLLLLCGVGVCRLCVVVVCCVCMFSYVTLLYVRLSCFDMICCFGLW